jgi:hypothetical protein
LTPKPFEAKVKMELKLNPALSLPGPKAGFCFNFDVCVAARWFPPSVEARVTVALRYLLTKDW